MEQLSGLKLQGSIAKVIVTLLLFILTFSLQAQVEIQTAKTYLSRNAITQKLTSTDIAEMSVSSAYLSPTTGWYHIYFNQTYQSVEVYNALLNVTIKDGQVVNLGNSFVSDLTSKVPTGLLKSTINITPLQAIQNAATNVSLKANNLQPVSIVQLADGTISKGLYTDSNLSNEKIEAKLYWLPYDGQSGEKAKSKIALTWDVRFTTKDGKNAWSIHVDALNGNILQKIDNVIHCNFGTPQHLSTPHICIDEKPLFPNNTALVAPNNYNVFDYPLESPNHGSRTIVSSPYTRFVPTGTGPGATNGWHNDGTTNYTNTRGNNVWAKDDLADDDEATIGSSPSSVTLDFNYPYTQATGTAAANLNACITNLFYWNNVTHDVLWQFGFDEPSGNFQKDNQGKGGAGNDYVFADAQDGSGTDNANFYTPSDGTNGRMQMYIFSNTGSPTYQPDSDFDNGVITHEYGHGWSTRLTGGPANSNCLNNAEQAGEGWSDYLALMLTTNWSSLTPSIASANIPRGIGTYVLGQPITGAGIRPFRYSYDKTNINPTVTYAGVSNSAVFSLPHGIGSIWATMLWDMTWEIILQDNQIVNNIYSTPVNTIDMKGNIAALKLVNEGLRLQPCSPSFIQSRDAILQADQLLFGGRYRCAIGRAFARRGLGAYASTGSSTNDRVVTEDYTPISSLTLTSALTSTTCSNNVFTYTATSSSATTGYSWTRPAIAGISNSAGSGSSANVSETLINTTTDPITVKYYFTLSEDACSVPQTISVVVSPFLTPTVTAYSVCQNATVPSGEGLVVSTSLGSSINGALTAGTTYQRGTGNNVTVFTPSGVGTAVNFKTYTFIAPSTSAVTFETTNVALSPGDPYDTYLSLYQTSFNPASPATNFLRGDDDSGALQYASKLTHNLVAGTTYIIVVSTYANSVTGTFSVQASTPIFGQTINWYLNASGGSPLATGSVFNPVGVTGSGITNTGTIGTSTFYVADALYSACRTPVTFTIGSVAGAVTADAIVCSGSNSGTLTLSGYTGSIIRWESSTDNFVNVTTIANTTTTQNYSNITQTTKYRAIVQNGACVSANSTAATITVSPATVAGTVTTDASVCAGTNSGTLTVAGHTGSILRWESSVDNFANITTIANTTTTQNYSNLTQTTKYRAVLQNGSCPSANASPATITVLAPAVPVATGATINSGSSVTLTATGCAGSGFALKWYQTTDNIEVTMPVSPTVNTQYYAKCQQTSGVTVCLSNKSNDVTVTVSSQSVPPVASGATICKGSSTTLTATGCTGENFTLLWFQNADDVEVNMPVAPTLTTQYYARCRETVFIGTTPYIISDKSNVVTISVLDPAIPVATGATINTGNSVTLTATGCTGAGFALKWYQTTDNVEVTMPVSPTINTQYYAKCQQTSGVTVCLSNKSNDVTVTVVTPPAIPVASGATICKGSSTTLTAMGCTGENFTLLWFQNADDVEVNMPVAPTLTTQYYARCRETVFIGTTPYIISDKSNVVTISVLDPAIPVATGATINTGNSVTLTATGCTGAGFALKWYQTTDNVEVTMPVSPTINTQYYAKCQQTSGVTVCLSNKSNDVTVMVETLPSTAIIYVNIANTAAPIQNGTSWATAYSNLKTALQAFTIGSEIWVAQGTYKPSSTNSRMESFNIPSGAIIYGGFMGTETNSTQRDFTNNPTILSGEIGTALVNDNSYHVVTFIATNNTTILDGFTIKGGNANLNTGQTIPPPSASILPLSINDGGGIGLDNGSNPTINNCRIINNYGTTGGGLFATNGSNPTITNTVFMGNQATFGGGAYHIGSSPSYKNILFAGNTATGGAIYNNVSSPRITNVTIAGNGGYNGGIFNSASSPVVKNSILWGNIGPFNDTQSIITYSIVEGGYSGVGNLNVNPQFVSLTPYGLSPSLSGDYKLTNTSSAIDAGENGAIGLTDKDLIGNLRRFAGGIVDLGAYEFQGSRVGGTVISIVSGNWENATTWNVGRSPLAGDNVIINNNHNVTINDIGTAKTIEFKTNAKIIYSTITSTLQLGY
ncbi:MAG: M36 family metallopeptidase [Bacteroidota bacterium]